ncbi:MAG: methyltransferase domain-containing protein [Acidimicrobiales bacterium]|nr:methyltransferase domain-containing protein [Acidimicrobiales bacterium]RZV46418.1 MAG: methyltransferase domain-containing protein [Acidimicrobiales bacterium]
MSEPEDEPDLDLAYSIETPDDSRSLYARWAATYDENFIEKHAYVYHENVVGLFLDAGGSAGGVVLDVGCGTGVVGVALGDVGEKIVDGVDISPEMLDVARGKLTVHGQPAYRNLIEADLTQTVPIGDDTYSGIISVGAFTHGHLGPEAIDELVRIAAPSAVCAIGINAKHYAEFGFDRWFASRSTEGGVTSPQLVNVSIYEAGKSEHSGERAEVAVFQVLAS